MGGMVAVQMAKTAPPGHLNALVSRAPLPPCVPVPHHMFRMPRAPHPPPLSTTHPSEEIAAQKKSSPAPTPAVAGSFGGPSAPVPAGGWQATLAAAAAALGGDVSQLGLLLPRGLLDHGACPLINNLVSKGAAVASGVLPAAAVAPVAAASFEQQAGAIVRWYANRANRPLTRSAPRAAFLV